jgi:hypothetical protein
MEIRIKAMRSLLYETSRYVDVYKAYTFLSEKRKLEAEERQEFKKYSRMADIFTPLLKLVSSEYSNSIAYDALQVHGGAGFMKDFPVERLYRDARITSIYEGTSQLQVVAAVRGVGTGGFLSWIKDQEAVNYKPELEYLKKLLMELTNDYEKMVQFVNEKQDNEFMDFHARRLVEMAGNIIMGYLLLNDTTRDEDFQNSAELFIKMAAAQNSERKDYILKSDMKDLGIYKY